MAAFALVMWVLFQTPAPSTAEPIATITVLKDVSLERYDRAREEEHIRTVLQFFGTGLPATIPRGQSFQMISKTGQTEGGCRIRYQKREYDIGSCWWLDGFSDHRTDIFTVK